MLSSCKPVRVIAAFSSGGGNDIQTRMVAQKLSANFKRQFVIETVSVIGQVFAFKTFGKRIFLMAPIHHHFEKKGWAEPKIIVRFWIIAIMLAIASLSSLKLR